MGWKEKEHYGQENQVDHQCALLQAVNNSIRLIRRTHKQINFIRYTYRGKC